MARKKIRHVGSDGHWCQIAAFLITDDGLRGLKVWHRESPNGQIRFCCPFHGNDLNIVLEPVAPYYELEGLIYKSSRPMDIIRVPKPEPKFEITHHCPSCDRKFDIISRLKAPLEWQEVVEQVRILG